MKRKAAPKERNPFVQHLINKRGAGVHGKSKKAIRRQEKVQLQKDYSDKIISLVV